MASATSLKSSAPAHDAFPPPTPMIAQYIEIKAANSDCLLFYRMGDFYEMFFDDAETASRVLGIVLTKRGTYLGQDIPMSGVPVERADDYLQRLIAAGHRIAVCEQTENPVDARKRGPKSVVRRDVVRLVTPGTVTEERLLEPGVANVFVSLSRRQKAEGGFVYGVASIDISTGRFTVTDADEAGLTGVLARLEPREIVVPDSLHRDDALGSLLRDAKAALTPFGGDGIDAASAERRVREAFDVATLDAFGAFSEVELLAAASALAYVERTQLDSRPALSPPVREGGEGVLQIDAATRASLEVSRTVSGDRAGSLLATIDRTKTPAGARCLAIRLAGPLTDIETIACRQDAIAWFIDTTDIRTHLRTSLSGAPDLARALGRLSLGRGGPRDLACIRDGLQVAAEVAGLLREASSRLSGLPSDVAARVSSLEAPDPTLTQTLAQALADTLPLLKRDGGFIRTGYDSALDRLRVLQGDSRKIIIALQARYVEETNVRTLRIKHNAVLGYFLEVPQGAGEILLKEPWAATFIHRQTMTGAMRFCTVELGEIDTKISSAAEEALACESGHFDALTQALLAAGETIKRAADALGDLDATAALADLAADLDWTRPVVDDSLVFTIEGGRHPVVEAACAREGVAFIGNDCTLSAPLLESRPAGEKSGGRICLVTGPNMAGKSTYLRQNALIVLLAQMGAFVPARHAHIGVVDRLFSRVGASDDLARGRSTFMVEMIETAAILNQATPRSLVILDEIGRGTSTFDGLSIAWASVEHLHETNRCRALFATHFHELTALADRLPRVSNASMRVTEWKGGIVFLHEVVAGAADRSYGVQVAKLAGLPRSVTDRARVILKELEKSGKGAAILETVDDLPLFASTKPAQGAAPDLPDPVHEALDGINPDDLTPKQALEALYSLKRASLKTPHP